jgi:hypothetical protein
MQSVMDAYPAPFAMAKLVNGSSALRNASTPWGRVGAGGDVGVLLSLLSFLHAAAHTTEIRAAPRANR